MLGEAHPKDREGGGDAVLVCASKERAAMGKDARMEGTKKAEAVDMFVEKPNLVLMSCPIGESASLDAFSIVTPATEGS
jgi:hypothetical protein